MKDKMIEFFKNKNNLIVFVLLGVLLFVITIPISDGSDSESGLMDKDGNRMIAAETGYDNSEIYGAGDLYEYSVYMEEKLKKVLAMIEGAGKVEVVISFKSSEEKVALKDQTASRSGTEETDSQGGSRNISNFDSDESTVYSAENGGSIPYVIKVLQPEVEGVIVIAEGAGTGRVSKNISDAIQALFGLEAHKITIVKMETP